MANEYLKRQPTSSGNSRRWTISFWMKNSDPTQGYTSIIGAGKVSPTNVYNEIFYNGSQTGLNLDNSSASDNYNITANPLLRDPSSWMHVVVSFTDQGDNANTRIKFYINGAFVDHNTGTGLDVSETSFFNHKDYIHYIGSRAQQSAGTTTFDGQYFDVFLVDGQALTPDVFGFYKDGDGYISVGSTQSTDFKPGQWMPHSPTKIKKDINRRGGFGVNGYYLPMNDPSNPGADFHCAPNSIIKLKGEDLPQPRNGAPTTSDAFVSQLRQETGTLGFDGAVKLLRTGGYLDLGTSHSDLVPGSGDFTIECFLYPQGFGNYPVIVDSRTNSGDTLGFFLGFNTNGQLYLYTHSGERNAIILTKGRWYHIALVRQSNVFKLYVDGVKVGTDYTQSQNYTNQIRYIGESLNSESQNWNIDAFISNFRFVKGTAVYTANFTAPTEPLTNVTNTKLLCCNSSTSATAATVAPGTITAVGGAFATRNELTGSISLAVPGISTATGANLVTNGSFDSNVSGWTAVDATLTWNAGRAQTNRTGGSGYTAYQQITVVSGQRYTVSGLIDSTGGGNRQDIRVLNNLATNGGSLLVNILGTDNEIVERSGSFTATGTTHYVYFVSDGGGTGFFDNVVVKQEDAPRDYSADIKGSGTNKAVQASLGTGGIGYELGGYYGSAINASDNNCGHAFSGADSAFVCPGDFTVELWLDPVVATQPQGNPRILGQTNNSGGKWDIYIDVTTSTNRIYTMGGQVALTGGNGSDYGNFVPGQWNHFCLERSGSIMTTYMNGVAVYTQTYTNTIGTTDFLYLGSYGDQSAAPGYGITGKIQDFRFYKGVAKYKGGFDVSKPYTPVGIEAFRTTTDTCKNNFATLNSLDTSQLSATNGNLSIDQSSGGWHSLLGTHYVRSGKWYAEMRIDRLGWIFFGVEQTWLLTRTKHVGGQTGSKGAGLVYNTGNRGDITYNGTNSAYTGGDATAATGDIISIALDLDSNNVKFYKNNVLQYNLNNILESGADYTFGVSPYSNVAVTVNFGQNPSFSGTVTAGTNADGNGKGLFKYAPPTGFLALCEDNLPTPAIADPGKHFKTVLYTGDGTNGHSITGVGFKPDFVWVKCRNTSKWHALVDSVRGNTKTLHSNSANAEGTETHVSSFDNNGFTVADIDSGTANENGFTYVAWCWKAGGAAASNSDGSITSQVSANQDAGFSIVSYTGNNTAGATIGHGLGKKPSMMIVKERTGASGWFVYHKDLGATKFLSLHDVTAAGTETGNTACWYATEPNTSVFTVGQNGATNENNRPIIAYCWTEIEGYSKFGSYIGNNSADGPFAYCGFKPAWVLIKKTNGSGDENWRLFDSSRCSTNQNNKHLLPSNPAAESTETGMDFLSNGFKLRHTDAHQNQNETTYIFAAFAESPFQTANAK